MITLCVATYFEIICQYLFHMGNKFVLLLSCCLMLEHTFFKTFRTNYNPVQVKNKQLLMKPHRFLSREGSG